MSVVIPRSRTEMQWSPGAAGPLLSEEDRAARSRSGDGEEPTWQDAAACQYTDPEAFFVEKGGSTAPAKKVCVACPVRAECLEFALEHDERFGVWGGLSERERRRIKPLAGLPAGVVTAEADERARRPLARLPDGRITATRQRQEVSAPVKGIAA